MSLRLGSIPVLALLALAGARQVTAGVPPGFADEAVASVGSPTAVAFTPDGRLLIATQPGRLRVIQAGVLLAAPALDLAATLCSNSERGLLGVAVDPAFGSTRRIYLYYTFNRNGDCANAPVNRVSRFVLADSNLVVPGSEQVLVDNIRSTAGNHNGGDLAFGKDGHLYVSVGDGGCDYAPGGGCAGNNDASRDKNVLLGKILRITADGGIPTDNPFQGPGTARCNVAGSTTAAACQETFAWGLRNPYRIAFDPDAAATRLFINDVGQDTWEEIDEGVAGADYGWNCREGAHTNSTTGPCAGVPPSSLRDPIFEYNHSTGCASITGGAFVPDGAWPAEFDDDYLFGDYVCGRLFRLTPLPAGGWVASSFGDALGSLVSMTFGPDGALYYSTYSRGVRRIRATADRPPVARVQANPATGAAPLTVTFDGSASSDPDPGTPIAEYRWDFGDSTSLSTTAPSTVHVYGSPGTFTASLRVASGSPALVSDPATVLINAGNRPPVPAIVLPLAADRFSVGQAVTLVGTATDPDEGPLGGDSLSWTVLLHHAQHTHPFLGPVSGLQVPLVFPAPEDLAAAANSFLEVRLTATDRFGATATVAQNMLPLTVPVAFTTQPAGLEVVVNGQFLRAPFSVTSWAGYGLDVDAPAQEDGAGNGFAFASWSDGGSRRHTIVTPATSAAFVASFAPFPEIGVADAGVREGQSGTRTIAFTATLSAPCTEAVAFDFATADGTAQAGSDYTAVSGRLSFAPGETARTIDVLVTGDHRLEANETFRLLLAHPANGRLPRGESRGTILNDDAAVDWSSDGKPDLLWQNAASGAVALWQMDDVRATGAVLLDPSPVPTRWRIAAAGDFNDDGQADILWQDRTLGVAAVWYMSGTTASGAVLLDPAQPPAGWRVAGAADFNGDGKPDVVWQDPATGALAAWFMDGVTRTGSSPFTPGQAPAGWTVAAVTDWNGDGQPDLVWQNAGTGQIGFWAMDGLTATSAVAFVPGQVPTNWRIAAVADYDRDGKPDLVWQDDSAGVVGLWHMDGLAARDAVPLAPGQVPASWGVVAPK
jgi:glucose/arabinose dehydrogenase/PKD repeat protein